MIADHVLKSLATKFQTTELRIDFQRELKEFLPRSHWAIMRDFPAPLEREIARFL